MTAPASATRDTTSFRTLIVDDERHARIGLRAMLTQHPELLLAGEASNGVEAAMAIRVMAPDLIFLDIQMPEQDGIRMLASLEVYERPAVVFVTAHRQYAFDAFGVGAVDYLLKPFSRQRFALAVRRALQFLRGAAAGSIPQGGPTGLETSRARTRRLAVRDRDRLVFVEPVDVEWFEVYGNYLRLAVGGRQLLLKSTLRAIAAQLDPAAFVRISRSVAVNVQQVMAARDLTNGQYELVLAGGTVWRSSRRYRRAVQAALGK